MKKTKFMICLVVFLGSLIPNMMGFASIHPKNFLSQALLNVPEIKEGGIHPLVAVDKVLVRRGPALSLSLRPEKYDRKAMILLLKKKITTEVKWHYSDLKTRMNQLSEFQIAQLKKQIAPVSRDNGFEFKRELIKELTEEEKLYGLGQQQSLETLSVYQLFKIASFFGIKDLDQL